jgi:hypothetical protein
MRAGPLFQWSGRDLGRHRVKAALVFLALSTLTAMVATVLLLNQSVALTFDRLLDHSPAIIVRQVGGGGWLPLPVEAALSAVRAVPGVVQPRARIWGVVSHGDQAVTIVGLGQQRRGLLPDGFQSPGRGGSVDRPRCDGGSWRNEDFADRTAGRGSARAGAFAAIGRYGGPRSGAAARR